MGGSLRFGVSSLSTPNGKRGKEGSELRYNLWLQSTHFRFAVIKAILLPVDLTWCTEETKESCSLNKKAGVDWLANFLKRNNNLAIRQPEATSLARCTIFYKNNVSRFFEKLGDIYQRCNLEPYRIWNMDKTGVNTVLGLNKIVASKGTKQAGAVTSAERGEQVTVAAAVNAQGSAMLPMILFPRKNILYWGSQWVGLDKRGNVRNVCAPLYQTHVEAINLCRKHDVVMLSFPPHCSHRLQPLDLSVFGPFKRQCSSGIYAWLKKKERKINNSSDEKDETFCLVR
ncbi:hypothetical protein ILUMI_18548 [Ignelater luminosus]|uniref:DDE-1 domain-containing protein n=1 Tax=Ignelater luminosus TaxID=2038154 RepID=A0A8K0G0S7_IGNLU|nr:hypothetical protein ILUMI_18548 [Ignelater luminosus]